MSTSSWRALPKSSISACAQPGHHVSSCTPLVSCAWWSTFLWRVTGLTRFQQWPGVLVLDKDQHCSHERVPSLLLAVIFQGTMYLFLEVSRSTSGQSRCTVVMVPKITILSQDVTYKAKRGKRHIRLRGDARPETGRISFHFDTMKSSNMIVCGPFHLTTRLCNVLDAHPLYCACLAVAAVPCVVLTILKFTTCMSVRNGRLKPSGRRCARHHC